MTHVLRPRSLPFIAPMLLCLAVSAAEAFSSSKLIAPRGGAIGDEFGHSAASAGDFNGDGYSDVIVGAFMEDANGADAGRAYIYFGGPQADEIPDVTLTGAATGDFFGISVAVAGDFNGDGYSDVIVGAQWNDAIAANAGRAYVYFGGANPDNVADVTLNGATANDEFGNAVAGAGDMNGDGFDDVIVGAHLNDAAGANAGRAYVFYGGATPNNVVDRTLTGAAGGDEFGLSVDAAGDLNGDGYGDVIVGAPKTDTAGIDAGSAYIYYGGPTNDVSADLTVTGAAAGDLFGYAVGTAGDFNGDGYDDCVVGAFSNDSPGVDAGRAYIYYGGGSADATADLILSGAAAGDQFGGSVSLAGDVNLDGFSDVIVGANVADASGSSAGEAYIYFGSSAPNSGADVQLLGGFPGQYFGESVASAGDVDGDGYPDVIVGASLDASGGIANAGRAFVFLLFPYQLLSPNGGEQWVADQPVTVLWRGHDAADLALSTDGGATYSTLASGVGGADDNEYTLTCPATPTDAARVRLSFRGQTATRASSDASDHFFRIVTAATPPAATTRLQATPTGAAASDFLGQSAAGAGDMNGDGFDDWIVGAPGNDDAGADAGRAYVYFGGPAADAVADISLIGAAAGDNFGVSVAAAGDVNGDGYADVIVGARFNDAVAANAGRAYVFYGGTSPDAIADLTLSGAASGDNFGTSVAGAGDVNGDGYSDIVVGAPLNNVGGTSAGQVYVYFGGLSPDAASDLTLTGATSFDSFGQSVAGAGDVNGDGYSDVIAGANGNDAGGVNAGRAYVFYGGPFPNAVADLTLTGAATGDSFGSSVAGAGDLNGDGFADVVVGAYLNDAGGSNAGRTYVYFGGPSIDAAADLVLTGAAGDNSGLPVRGAGDVNDDGFDDVLVGAFLSDAGGVDAGRANIYYGAPAPDAVADLTLTGAAAGDEFGLSVGGAGDVNGDGFDDIIAGAPLNDAGGPAAGRAYLRDCRRYVVLSPNDDEVWNVGAGQTVTWRGAEPADLWLSSNGGVTYDLLRHDVGGEDYNAVNLLVPNAPTKFARVKVTPVDGSVTGYDESDSLFTIQASIALLNLKAEPIDGGVLLSWTTNPGPEDLAGYRLERSRSGQTWSVLAELIRETSYRDPEGGPGWRYRLSGVNGLGQVLVLGETGLGPVTALAAWPLPYRGGTMNISFLTAGGLGGAPAPAEVAIYDVSGRRVRTVVSGDFASGSWTAAWDGRDDAGDRVAGGIYFLRAVSGGVGTRLKIAVAR